MISTADQGQTWKTLSQIKNAVYGSVFGKDAQHQFVLTLFGIVESKDGGATWLDPIPLPRELKGVGNLSWLEYDSQHDVVYVMKMASELYQWKRPAK